MTRACPPLQVKSKSGVTPRACNNRMSHLMFHPSSAGKSASKRGCWTIPGGDGRFHTPFKLTSISQAEGTIGERLNRHAMIIHLAATSEGI